ncbi:MAG: trigger factor [Puniceicoccales bacterium]|nr:trigger factor [Puniceicoccales bacterium]
MKIEIQDVDELRKVATLSCDPRQVEIEENLILRVFCKDARISGFRKGKVPEEVVRRRFAGEIQQRLRQKLVQTAYEDLLKEKNWEVFAVVAVDGPEGNPEEGFKISFTLDLRPEVKLEDYRHFPLTPFSVKVGASELEESLQQLRRQHADYRKVDRAAQKGDFVRLNYKGLLSDGSEIAERAEAWPVLGEQRNVWEEAGAEEPSGLRCIADALVGLREGDVREVSTDFPAHFEVPALAGQAASYRLQVLEVREVILPEWEADFFRRMKVEGLEALKEKIFQGLQARKRQQGRQAQREELIRLLLSRISFPIPESALIAEQERLLKNFTEQQAPHVLSSPGFKDRQKEFFEQALAPARQRAALNFILEHVAKKEKIGVTSEDMQRILLQDAAALRVPAEKLFKELQQDRQRLRELQQRVILGKALDFLLAINTETSEASPDGADSTPLPEARKA